MDVIDSESRSSSVALEQFLILCKSAKGCAAVELIRQVLESPAIYVFGELLDMPNIKELANNCEYESYYKLLNVFAFGTYNDYLKNCQHLPQLTDQMKNKLRHLTIVSLATKRKHIPYSLLLTELDMKNLRELEDLIIGMIYANVVQGKMDQNNNRLEIDHTIGRDIKVEDLKTVSHVLNEWCRNCDNVLRNIELQINNANTLKDDNYRIKQNIETQVNNIKKTIKTQDMDEAMSTDVVNSSPRDPRDVNFEKMKRNAGKGKGLRGSGGKFWRRDN